jgi:hypothetical protein
MARFVFLLICAVLLSGCEHSPPKDPQNACSIYQEFPDWLVVGKAVKKRWGTPLSLQLAIIYTESRFLSSAQPKRESMHLFHKSSARGYAQALDGTWRRYVHSKHQLAADRENFADASDFIGWYTHSSKKRFGLPYSNAYAHYLAFHEGWGGYASGSYRKKRQLVRLAHQVQRRTDRYRRQLLACTTHASKKESH